MSAKISAASTNKGYREQKIATCRKIVTDVINQYNELRTTLGTVPNIDSVMISLLSIESAINEGIYISRWSEGAILKHRTVSSSVRKAYERIGYRRDSFVNEVILPHGVGQVMGYHLISDWTDYYPYFPGTKKNVFEVIRRKDGVSFLVGSNAAIESINNSFKGEDALENGIRASLAILVSKLPNTTNSVTALDLRTAVKRYLGNGKDKNGMTPDQYASNILDGGRVSVASASTISNYELAKNAANGKSNSDSTKVATSGWSCTA